MLGAATGLLGYWAASSRLTALGSACGRFACPAARTRGADARCHRSARRSARLRPGRRFGLGVPLCAMLGKAQGPVLQGSHAPTDMSARQPPAPPQPPSSLQLVPASCSTAPCAPRAVSNPCLLCAVNCETAFPARSPRHPPVGAKPAHFGRWLCCTMQWFF